MVNYGFYIGSVQILASLSNLENDGAIEPAWSNAAVVGAQNVLGRSRKINLLISIKLIDSICDCEY